MRFSGGRSSSMPEALWLLAAPQLRLFPDVGLPPDIEPRAMAAIETRQARKRSARAVEPVRVRSAPSPSSKHPPSSFDRDYWLGHAEGFRVDAHDGRLGFVEEISRDGAEDLILHVRAGVLGRRVLLVPASSVEFIVPRAKRLWLHSPVQIAESRAA